MPSGKATKKPAKKAHTDSPVAPVGKVSKKPLAPKAAQKAANKAKDAVRKGAKIKQTKKVALGKALPTNSAPARLPLAYPAEGLGIFVPATLKRAWSRLDQEKPSQSASHAAALVKLGQASPSQVRKPTATKASTERQEVGLFLVRSTASSAAQALSSYPVELNADSRKRQIDRLRDFRNDTKAQVAEAERWLLDHNRQRGTARSSGLISAGRILQLTPEEATELRRDVRGIQVIENRVLSIVTPTRVTLAVGGASEAACWHLEAIGQRTARRDGRAFSGRGVHVAVLDTGVQLDHPELAGRVFEGWKIDPRNPAVDASAVVRDTQHRDTDGHGTHVAGLICGTTVGVAPGAQVMSMLMMPRGYATTFDFIRCLDWAAEQPEIALVNFSAGEFPFNDDMMPLVDDLIRTGVLPFFAVGNDGQNRTRSPGNYIDGISVGSVDPPQGGTVSAFSGSGQMTYNHTSYEVPDIVAPGGRIHSSYRGGGYAELDGTSMATPIACGVAACFLERAGGALSPGQLSDLLYRSCTSLAGELKIRQGHGLVQVPSR
ncbi:MAG: S8 family serine peptidase [Xanthomonadales bacterium]|nr:S8 family serine peptidase [Xanthomonadales bacterium]